MGTGLKYRPDIDGLRAVAVILVVMYHLGVGFTKGGFIGVDVFFVISGYLITGIIASEVGSGAYSLLGFYERRVRRLFPALFGVLLFSSCLAYILLFPPELEYFGETLIATTTFLANILFYSGDGYFAGTRDTIPLLHTWSLAVEEQFYLLYPLVLAPLLRRDKGTLCWPIFSLTLLLSFALSLFLVKYDQSAAFYLLPPRAWELLLGCLLALGAIPELRNEKYRQLASIAGLLAILIAAGKIRGTTFPGWAALVPCVGAAMVIHSGVKGDTIVYRVLSSRYAVFIGLISYSLYLWHWPIIAFYKAQHGGRISKPEMLLLAIASIAAATLSWRYVERPFRQRTILPRRAPMFSVAALASTSAIERAILFLATEGLSNRYPASVRQLAAFKYKPEGPMRSGHCFITNGYADKLTVDEMCLRLDAGRRNFLLVGDSFAAHHWAGLTAVFPDINFLQATASVCKPILDGGDVRRCRSVVDAAFSEFIPNTKLDGVILAGAWAASDIPRVLKTIEAVRKNVDLVYVFGPMIVYDDMLPRLLARSESLQDPSLITRHREPNRSSWDQSFARAVEASGARYVSFYRALCDSSDNCMTRDEKGDPIQFDGGHLTRMGSIAVAKVLRDRRMLE
jgi:peptidoglycan/LPS O-acetylase OafA/YrhL